MLGLGFDGIEGLRGWACGRKRADAFAGYHRGRGGVFAEERK